MAAQSITNAEFLASIFANIAAGEVPWITWFPDDPAKVPEKRWFGSPPDSYAMRVLRDAREKRLNTFFSVASIKPTDGEYRRQYKNFGALHVLVADDVGTKGAFDQIVKPRTPPTYILETSPGSFHIGYRLDPPVSDPDLADRIYRALIAQGIASDNSMNRVRYARLPVGHNTKGKYGPDGFAHVLHHWRPNVGYSVDQLVDAFKLDLSKISSTSKVPVNAIPPQDDPYVAALARIGQLLSTEPNPRGFLPITCPWAHEHSEGTPEAAYMPGGGFSCLHDHCSHRSFADLKRWLRNRYGELYGEDLSWADRELEAAQVSALDTTIGPMPRLLEDEDESDA